MEATKLSAVSDRNLLALELFRHFFGSDGICCDGELLNSYAYSCGLRDCLPLCVLFPESVDEIRRALVIANEHTLPVHPISAGKNWGYGAACAAQPGVVILDLHRMNRIVEFNEELAYVVVEPGVTQAQLFNFLADKSVAMDVTGSTPFASLIGNLAERGYGQSTYGDHFLNSASMEVVLADGRVIQTGFGHYPNNTSAYLYKWGIGPYLDGLFTQSNFGIITKICIWLMRRPLSQGALLVTVDSDIHLTGLIEALRELKLRGVITATTHIANDIRAISTFEQFPFARLPLGSKLTDSVRSDLRNKYKLSLWNCFTSLHGSPRGISAALREVRKAVGTLGTVKFISERQSNLARKILPLVPVGYQSRLKKMLLAFSLVTGSPTDRPLLGAYWRKRTKATSPYDPTQARCGITWCAPVFPSTKQHISRFLKITSECLDTFGFDFNVNITLISDRACCSTVGVISDCADPLESQRAADCRRQLMQLYLDHGYIPYRYGNSVADCDPRLFSADDPFWQICNELKRCFDPNLIINPGKYGITG